MESPQLSSRLPFFQRLFCCGRRALSSKQYASNYRNGDENFGVAAEKDGVRNKLQSFGYVPRDSHYLISCRLTACLSLSSNHFLTLHVRRNLTLYCRIPSLPSTRHYNNFSPQHSPPKHTQTYSKPPAAHAGDESSSATRHRQKVPGAGPGRDTRAQLLPGRSYCFLLSPLSCFRHTASHPSRLPSPSLAVCCMHFDSLMSLHSPDAHLPFPPPLIPSHHSLWTVRTTSFQSQSTM